MWGEDADKFVPERWQNEEKVSHYKVRAVAAAAAVVQTAHRAVAQFPVFNAGPRLCLGKPLALLESRTLMSMLAARFRFKRVRGLHAAALCAELVAHGQVLGHDYAYRLSLILAAKNGMKVTVSRRDK
jgi:cytochrome P450